MLLRPAWDVELLLLEEKWEQRKEQRRQLATKIFKRTSGADLVSAAAVGESPVPEQHRENIWKQSLRPRSFLSLGSGMPQDGRENKSIRVTPQGEL